jgi:hypothetical protein
MQTVRSRISKARWTREYKRALLEINPLLRVIRIEYPHNMMSALMRQVPTGSPEHKALKRGLGILDTLREAYLIPIQIKSRKRVA